MQNYNLKFKNFYFFPVFFTFSFLLLPLVAQSATLYLMPQSQTVYQNNSFIVDVRLDTEDEEINVTEIYLNFPSNLLEAVDISRGNSILTLWVEEPKIKEEKIIFIGGVPGFKGDGLIGRLTFLGKEIGKAQVSFREDSRVLLNDGKGTPVQLSFQEGNYEIVEKPEGLPLVTSQSHPDQNSWYPTTTLQLHWDLVEGAEYSWILSKTPLDEPDEIPDKPAPKEGVAFWMGAMTYDLSGEGDGIYYFLLKQKLPNKNWSEKVIFRAMIDATPPEKFELKIGKDPAIFEGKYFLSFVTQDKMSGIDYYEVKEGRRDFKRAVSPYLLEDQNLRQKIIVRAYDKAGNYQEAKFQPPSKISWQDFILPFLILIGIGILIWWVLRRSPKTPTKIMEVGPP